MRLALDTCILTGLCNPKGDKPLADWFSALLEKAPAQVDLVVPEIADYELRRGLLYQASYYPDPLQRGRFLERVKRLDWLKQQLEFLAINEQAMLRASNLWALAKGTGRRTAPEQALDGDVILAAQALEGDCEVVTHNRRHLAVYSVPIFPLAQHLSTGRHLRKV